MKIREIIAEQSQLDEVGGKLGMAWNAAKGAIKDTPGVANKINAASDIWNATKSRAASGALSKARAFFTVTSGAMSLLKTWQMLDPLYVYNKHMNKWEAEMKAGKISADQYELIREKELTQLIGQWAAILATNGILRAGMFPLLAGFKVFGLTTIYAFVNTLTKGAQAALMTWFNTDEGRKWIASALALGVIDDKDYVSAIVGGNIATLLDKLKGKVRKAPAEPANSAQGAQGAQAVDGAASDKAATQQPASSQKTNPQDYEYYSDTLVKNKKTGALELKDF